MVWESLARSSAANILLVNPAMPCGRLRPRERTVYAFDVDMTKAMAPAGVALLALFAISAAGVFLDGVRFARRESGARRLRSIGGRQRPLGAGGDAGLAARRARGVLVGSRP
jgi:hypothetical protein